MTMHRIFPYIFQNWSIEALSISNILFFLHRSGVYPPIPTMNPMNPMNVDHFPAGLSPWDPKIPQSDARVTPTAFSIASRRERLSFSSQLWGDPMVFLWLIVVNNDNQWFFILSTWLFYFLRGAPKKIGNKQCNDYLLYIFPLFCSQLPKIETNRIVDAYIQDSIYWKIEVSGKTKTQKMTFIFPF